MTERVTPPSSPLSGQPFGAERWALTTAQGAPLTLEPIGIEHASNLGVAITSIDPWLRMGYGAAAMAAYLSAADPGACRRALCRDGKAIGAVSVRYPWLRGPYLELLALLPGHQGAGAGAAIVDWMTQEVRGHANSLWVCTSSFNDRAQAFYHRHGFARVGDLDGLAGPGFTEILLRKRL